MQGSLVPLFNTDQGESEIEEHLEKRRTSFHSPFVGLLAFVLRLLGWAPAAARMKHCPEKKNGLMDNSEYLTFVCF